MVQGTKGYGSLNQKAESKAYLSTFRRLSVRGLAISMKATGRPFERERGIQGKTSSSIWGKPSSGVRGAKSTLAALSRQKR
jgi:hypothetical protein